LQVQHLPSADGQLKKSLKVIGWGWSFLSWLGPRCVPLMSRPRSTKHARPPANPVRFTV
jgi:hypothetical protein